MERFQYELAPELIEVRTGGSSVEPAPLAIVRAGSLYERYGKEALDRFLAVIIFVMLLPVMLTVAAAVYLALGRPVLLQQERIGLFGEPFPMLKFRTMRPDRRARQRPFSGVDRRVSHKRADDPRHVPVGRFLRKFSLDELPQLINVLRGEMSLVGPRPELPFIVDRYEPWQHRRHLVRPGITGLWQISQRGDGPMHQHVDVDLRYLDRVTLGTDLRILAATVPATVGRFRGT